MRHCSNMEMLRHFSSLFEFVHLIVPGRCRRGSGVASGMLQPPRGTFLHILRGGARGECSARDIAACVPRHRQFSSKHHLCFLGVIPSLFSIWESARRVAGLWRAVALAAPRNRTTAFFSTRFAKSEKGLANGDESGRVSGRT